MVGTIQEDCLHTHYGITCQGALLAGFLNSLFYSREVVLRNGSAENLLLKGISLIIVEARREFHHYITVLAVSTGLLLILTLYLGGLLNRLSISKLRLS